MKIKLGPIVVYTDHEAGGIAAAYYDIHNQAITKGYGQSPKFFVVSIFKRFLITFQRDVPY